MTIYSTDVTDGNALTSQYNKLRRDLLTHDHDGSETPAINHDDVDVSGATNDHSEIDTHIAAEKGHHSDGDADAYIALSYGGQLKIQIGSGSINLGAGGSDWWDNKYRVVFDPAYDSSPRVWVQQKDTFKNVVKLVFSESSGVSGWILASPGANSGNCEFYWVALGV